MKKKTSAKKAAPPQPKPAKRRFTRTEVITTPAVVVIDVDYQFIAATAPSLRAKDLVVFAMAIGGRVRMNDPKNPFRMQIEIEVTQ